MSQMAAMKISDFYQKRLTAQEIMMHSPIVAFPLFLQTHYIRNIAEILKVSCFSLIFISSLSSFQENDPYIKVFVTVHVLKVNKNMIQKHKRFKRTLIY